MNNLKIYDQMMSAGLKSGATVAVISGIVKAIFVLAIRLSFVAAVWLFLFDYHRWTGIALFFVLVLIFGDVVPAYKKTGKKEIV